MRNSGSGQQRAPIWSICAGDTDGQGRGRIADLPLSGVTYVKLTPIMRTLRVVAGRCYQPSAAAVAVIAAVSHLPAYGTCVARMTQR
jgi:hypothetical protein